MTIAFSTTLRTARAQAIITAAGANAKMKFYDGTRPASGAGIGGSTLLATLIAGATLGNQQRTAAKDQPGGDFDQLSHARPSKMEMARQSRAIPRQIRLRVINARRSCK